MSARRRPKPASDYHLNLGTKLFEERGWDEDTPEQAQIREHLRELVEELPEPHRSVVEMRIWKLWTFQQISDELDMGGRQYAYDHYQRGIRWLGDVLKIEGALR